MEGRRKPAQDADASRRVSKAAVLEEDAAESMISGSRRAAVEDRLVLMKLTKMIADLRSDRERSRYEAPRERASTKQIEAPGLARGKRERA
jgi:hypothetical protein